MSMWSSRQRGKEEEPVPSYNPPPEPVRERPAVTPSAPSGGMYASHGPAMVGKAVLVKGEIQSREDLYIDGEIQGTVELSESKLTIGPNGKIQATIRAREVVVFGNVQGNVEALEKIDIRKEAKLIGDIRTARIVIEDGAFFKGSIDIIKPELKPEAKAPVAPVASAPKPAAAPTPATASSGGDRPAPSSATKA